MNFLYRVFVAPLVALAWYVIAWAVMLTCWAVATGLLVLAAYLIFPDPLWQLAFGPAIFVGLAWVVFVANSYGGTAEYDKTRPGSRTLGPKQKVV